MMIPVDFPILSRTLATELRLRHTNYAPFVLSDALRLQLDASLDPDAPNVVVESYLQDWWTDLELVTWPVMSNETILEALEHHRTQLRRSSRKRRPSIPGPLTPAAVQAARMTADGYRTFFQNQVQLSTRRAAGFLMLSEAVGKKEDDHIIAAVGRRIPTFVDFAPPRPAEVLHSLNLQVDRTEVPPANIDLGIRLTDMEAMEVFSSPLVGVQQSLRLPSGSLHRRSSPPPQLDELFIGETFSSASHSSGPSELASDDIPSHFQKPPLAHVGTHHHPMSYRHYFAELEKRQAETRDLTIPGMPGPAAHSSPSHAGAPQTTDLMEVDSDSSGIDPHHSTMY